MTTTTAAVPVVLAATDVDTLTEAPLGPNEGVTHRVLWQQGGSMAGVLTVRAGSRLGVHSHRRNHHHIWILEGHARILGKNLGPGSYAYEPSGVEHDIDASDTEGCTVFYLYLRPPD